MSDFVCISEFLKWNIRKVQDTVISDDATQFTWSEFAKFCKFYSTEHITQGQMGKSRGL